MKPPYITAWSGECGYVVRHSPLIGMPAIFSASGRAGSGTPVWGKYSEERQRECVVRRRCQVCHRPLRLHGEPAFNLVAVREVLDRPSTTEPLTCRACVGVVLRTCPGVRRQIELGVAGLAAVRDYSVAVTFVQAVEGPEGNVELNEALRNWKGRPPVGTCEVLLTNFVPLDAPELLARAGVDVKEQGRASAW